MEDLLITGPDEAVKASTIVCSAVFVKLVDRVNVIALNKHPHRSLQSELNKAVASQRSHV